MLAGGPGGFVITAPQPAFQPRQRILQVSGHQPGSCEPASDPTGEGLSPQGGPHWRPQLRVQATFWNLGGFHDPFSGSTMRGMVHRAQERAPLAVTCLLGYNSGTAPRKAPTRSVGAPLPAPARVHQPDTVALSLPGSPPGWVWSLPGRVIRSQVLPLLGLSAHLASPETSLCPEATRHRRDTHETLSLLRR